MPTLEFVQRIERERTLRIKRENSNLTQIERAELNELSAKDTFSLFNGLRKQIKELNEKISGIQDYNDTIIINRIDKFLSNKTIADANDIKFVKDVQIKQLRLDRELINNQEIKDKLENLDKIKEIITAKIENFDLKYRSHSDTYYEDILEALTIKLNNQEDEMQKFKQRMMTLEKNKYRLLVEKGEKKCFRFTEKF